MIKVSKEIGERLNFMINDNRFNNESILNAHSEGWALDKNKCLSKLTLSQLAECLFLGYEVEKTKEDYILEEYIKFTETHKFSEYEHGYCDGYVDATRVILKILEIKIEGINE